MNFFESKLFPFIYIIKHIFLYAYQLTGSYGTAIILLSFSISLILLPIFILIEKAKKKDDVVKNKMKPLIDEIKRCYKGQERYYYIKTINRQHNYSSFRSLIPILSLLIQIPFFIAAYQFLESFAPLKGVSFMLINDLSIPDGLFGVVNALPILMTFVNLLTAYYYTRNGNVSERKQMLIVAGAFLILLFNLPSGLVLYWTMNNVFSFFRLFVTNREVFKKNEKVTESFIKRLKVKLPILKKVFVTILILSCASQLHWAFNYNFDDIFQRIVASLAISVGITFFTGIALVKYNKYKDALSKIKVKPQIYFILLFLSIYFLLASQFYYTGENILLVIISLSILIPTQIISYLYFKRYVNITSNRVNKYLLVLLLVFIIYQLIIMIVYLTGNDTSFSLPGIDILIKSDSLSGFIIVGIIYSLITVPYYIRYNNISVIRIAKPYYSIYILAILFILGLIFFWKPLIVYASSPDTFEFPAKNILLYNYKYFLIGSLIAFVSYIIIPKRYKSILLSITLLLVVISFIYSLVIPIQLGSLQVSQFSEQDKLAVPIGYFLLEAILLLCVYFGVKWIIKKSYFRITKIALIVFNILIIVQSLISAINTGSFNITQEEQNSEKSIGIPFSKDKENIVYFFADGFQGWYIKRIMEEEPELKEIFDGFVWYPNTISGSNNTHTSLPYMFAGLNYTVSEMNKDSIHTIEEKFTKTVIDFIKKTRDKGYFFSTKSIPFARIEPNQFDNYITSSDKALKKWSFKIPLGNENDVWKKRLYENALLYSVPLFLKSKIYNKTKWLNSIFRKIDDKKQNKAGYSFTIYNFIRLLPYMSVVNEGGPNFVFIHDNTPHQPYNTVNDLGEMNEDVTPYENNKWVIQQLARWIKWMKDNGVYDNTKIVLVSDHGAAWGMRSEDMDIKSIVKWEGNDPDKITPEQFWRLNVLLMVKDFKAKGSLKEDWRLMTNGDVPAIIFNENDPTKNEITARILPAYYNKWERGFMQKKRQLIMRQYEVKDNVFDLKNWKRILNSDNSKALVWNERTGRIYLEELKLDLTYINKERDRIINRIKKDKNWLNNVKKQAKERNISLDSTLVLSANYMIETEKNHLIIKKAQIMYNIKQNKDWLNNVKKQAQERNISLDSILEIAANCVVEQRNK